jgi:vacuolar-type H+-ATPase subunit C/Vma6
MFRKPHFAVHGHMTNSTFSQEIRNITWISECIAQNQKDRIGNYISVF